MNYTEQIDVRDQFNPSTGVFDVGYKEEDQGTYVFFFSAYKWKNVMTDIHDSHFQYIEIHKNGKAIQKTWEQAPNSENNGSNTIGMVTVNLKIGDKINLWNDAEEQIYVRNNDYPLTFMGYKI